MKNRIPILILAIVLAVMTGCDSEETTFKVLPSQEIVAKKHVTFFGFKCGAQKIEEIEKILFAYMEKYPKIIVSYESDPAEDYLSMLTRRLETGNANELFMINPSALSTFSQRNWIGSKLVDLGEQDIVQRYSPLMRKWITVDGKIPAVPMNMAVIGLLANNDILKQCGITAIPETYEAWVDSMRRIKEKGYIPFVNYWGNDDSLMFFVVSRTFARFLYQEVPFPEKLTVETLFGEALRDMDKDILPLEAPLYDSYKKALKDFAAQGKAAYIITPSWGLAAFFSGNPQFDYQYVGLPLADTGPVINARASIPVAVSAESPRKKEALHFLDFMMQSKYIETYSADQYALSPLEGATSSNPLYATVLKLIHEQKVFSDSTPEIPFNIVSTLNKLTRRIAAEKAGKLPGDKKR